MSTQHLNLLRILVRARMSHARRAETGASAVEWVVITALLVGIAVAVGAILLNTITNGARDIDLG